MDFKRQTIPQLDPDELQETWAQFVQDRDERSRTRLIEHYQTFVRKLAYRMLKRMPSHVEVEDLISYAQFGLLDAVKRFDPSTLNKFETFATPRIRGAMLDEMRSQDWAPRRVRSIVRESEIVTDILFRETGEKPTVEAVAARMGRQPHEVLAAHAEAGTASMSSLEGIGEWYDQEDSGQSDYALDAELMMTRDCMAQALSELPEQSQLLMELYYIRHLRMKEIGRVMGIGESHACHAHTQATLALREQMALIR